MTLESFFSHPPHLLVPALDSGGEEGHKSRTEGREVRTSLSSWDGGRQDGEGVDSQREGCWGPETRQITPPRQKLDEVFTKDLGVIFGITG